METQTTRGFIRAIAGPCRHPEVVEALTDGLDFAELEHELVRQRLLGLLGSRITAMGLPNVPNRFVSAVHLAVESNRARATANAMITWALVTELQSAGVRAMPLKGPLLAQRLHGDLAFRESDDIDLLVSARQMPNAILKLERIGATRPRRGEALPELHHHFRLGSGTPIELHWRIHWFETFYGDSLLERATMRDGIWVPSPADELISLLLFHARDGLIGLRMPVDVAACWDAHHDDATIERVRQTACDYPQLVQAIAAAALSVERVLDIDIASTLQLSMTSRSALAVDLTDWAVSRQPREIDLAVKLVDGLVAPRRGLPAYVRRSFFPRLEGPPSTRLLRRASHAVALSGRMLVACWAMRLRLFSHKETRTDADQVRLTDPLPLR